MLVLDLYESFDLSAGVCEFFDFAPDCLPPVSISIDRVSVPVILADHARLHIKLRLALHHSKQPTASIDTSTTLRCKL